MSSEVRRMFQRNGSTAQWASVNPILGEAEIGYDRDLKKAKVGDGVTSWNSLPYSVGRLTTPHIFDLVKTDSATFTAFTREGLRDDRLAIRVIYYKENASFADPVKLRVAVNECVSTTEPYFDSTYVNVVTEDFMLNQGFIPGGILTYIDGSEIAGVHPHSGKIVLGCDFIVTTDINRWSGNVSVYFTGKVFYKQLGSSEVLTTHIKSGFLNPQNWESFSVVSTLDYLSAIGFYDNANAEVFSVEILPLAPLSSEDTDEELLLDNRIKLVTPADIERLAKSAPPKLYSPTRRLNLDQGMEVLAIRDLNVDSITFRFRQVSTTNGFYPYLKVNEGVIDTVDDPGNWNAFGSFGTVKAENGYVSSYNNNNGELSPRRVYKEQGGAAYSVFACDLVCTLRAGGAELVGEVSGTVSYKVTVDEVTTTEHGTFKGIFTSRPGADRDELGLTTDKIRKLAVYSWDSYTALELEILTYQELPALFEDASELKAHVLGEALEFDEEGKILDFGSAASEEGLTDLELLTSVVGRLTKKYAADYTLFKLENGKSLSDNLVLLDAFLKTGVAAKEGSASTAFNVYNKYDYAQISPSHAISKTTLDYEIIKVKNELAPESRMTLFFKEIKEITTSEFCYVNLAGATVYPGALADNRLMASSNYSGFSDLYVAFGKTVIRNNKEWATIETLTGDIRELVVEGNGYVHFLDDTKWYRAHFTSSPTFSQVPDSLVSAAHDKLCVTGYNHIVFRYSSVDGVANADMTVSGGAAGQVPTIDSGTSGKAGKIVFAGNRWYTLLKTSKKLYVSQTQYPWDGWTLHPQSDSAMQLFLEVYDIVVNEYLGVNTENDALLLGKGIDGFAMILQANEQTLTNLGGIGLGLGEPTSEEDIKVVSCPYSTVNGTELKTVVLLNNQAGAAFALLVDGSIFSSLSLIDGMDKITAAFGYRLAKAFAIDGRRNALIAVPKDISQSWELTLKLP